MNTAAVRPPSLEEAENSAAGDSPTSLWEQARTTLLTRVDIAPLVYMRFVFGAIMFWEVTRYFGNGWIARYYIEPSFFFKYYGFGWIHPWPAAGMYAHFAVLGVLAICVMLGWRYRITSTLFFFGFTYVFLLDQSNYLNHFYLISLISFLMIFVPAQRAVSLDAGRDPNIRSETAPMWALWLLRLQLAIPYFYGGLAKLNGDWLQCEPMRAWMSARTDFPLIGHWFEAEWMVYAFSYGGLIFDLAIVPLLLIRRTRWLAVTWIVSFHMLNAQLFSIGIFPWFMLLATPVFLPPTFFRGLLRLFGVNAKDVAPQCATPQPLSTAQRGLAVVLLAFVVVQLTLPLRHWLYPGTPNWTEEGHRFAWHMKLRDKETEVAEFVLRDKDTNEEAYFYPDEFLSSRQERKMATRPDMILQFSHYLAERWRAEGHENVEVRANIISSLNGREPQRLIDPDVDLAKIARTLRANDWILPLQEPLRPSRDRF